MSELETADKKSLDSKGASKGIILNDSTPHASPGNGEANQAGSCCFSPIKPALTYDEQLALMESRGLAIPDKANALGLLADTNYYRLSGYWLKLVNGDSFKEGICFDDVWDVYALDADLRFWLWSAIAPIEIKLRTSFAYHAAFATGPMGYEDPTNFTDAKAHTKSMGSFHREVSRALKDRVPCVKHNMDKYGKLPVWAAVEVMSMGTVSRLYGNLSEHASYEGGMSVKAAVASDFEVRASYLTSWLRHLTYVRNICGHHNRFYNRLMTTRPKLLKMDSDIADTHKQFPTLIVLKRLYERSWPELWGDLYDRLVEIIEAHKGVDLGPMGFPEDWREILRPSKVKKEEGGEGAN